MEKYYDETSPIISRSEKNSDLYKETSRASLEDFNVNSNVKVLGINNNNIDIEKVKEMLDKKHRETPRRKTVENLVDFEEESAPINLEETREYDITTLLERAKEQKIENYDRARLKKIRDTQYDILKNLDLAESSDEKDSTENELLELIHTITEREFLKKDSSPLDILEDLKGNENTIVLDGLKEDIDNYTNVVAKVSNDEELMPVGVSSNVEDVIVENQANTISVDKSFFTNSMSFSQSDFDDFNDLKEEMKSNKLLIKILVSIVVIVLIVGMLLVLNSIFEWGFI